MTCFARGDAKNRFLANELGVAVTAIRDRSIERMAGNAASLSKLTFIART
jgi:hypothetical protein